MPTIDHFSSSRTSFVFLQGRFFGNFNCRRRVLCFEMTHGHYVYVCYPLLVCFSSGNGFQNALEIISHSRGYRFLRGL